MSTSNEYELAAEDLQPNPIQFEREKYVKALKEGEYANLGAFEFSPKASKKLEEILLAMLSKQSREALLPSVFPLAKELIVNAAKANLKFTKKKLGQTATPGALNAALAGRMEAFQELAHEARKLGLYVRIKSLIDQDGAYFLVKNNVPLSEEDAPRVRAKLAQAMTCENLAEYYLAQTGEQEGAGIGFAMIITSLKGMGLDGKHLTIGVEKDCTVARLQLPFAAFA